MAKWKIIGPVQNYDKGNKWIIEIEKKGGTIRVPFKEAARPERV